MTQTRAVAGWALGMLLGSGVLGEEAATPASPPPLEDEIRREVEEARTLVDDLFRRFLGGQGWERGIGGSCREVGRLLQEVNRKLDRLRRSLDRLASVPAPLPGAPAPPEPAPDPEPSRAPSPALEEALARLGAHGEGLGALLREVRSSRRSSRTEGYWGLLAGQLEQVEEGAEGLGRALEGGDLMAAEAARARVDLATARLQEVSGRPGEYVFSSTYFAFEPVKSWQQRARGHVQHLREAAVDLSREELPGGAPGGGFSRAWVRGLSRAGVLHESMEARVRGILADGDSRRTREYWVKVTAVLDRLGGPLEELREATASGDPGRVERRLARLDVAVRDLDLLTASPGKHVFSGSYFLRDPARRWQAATRSATTRLVEVLQALRREHAGR